MPDGFLPFARVARLFVFAHRPRTKTRATRVNFKKWPILNSKGYLSLLCPRKVEIILSDMVFAMEIFARVARVARAARVSDLAVWGDADVSVIRKLQKPKNRAAKLATNSPFDASHLGGPQ